MEQIEITNASLGDFKIIQAIGRQTFLETFADSNTEADINDYLEESFSEQRVRNELCNPDSSFFIAWENEIPVGYLKINAYLKWAMMSKQIS